MKHLLLIALFLAATVAAYSAEPNLSKEDIRKILKGAPKQKEPNPLDAVADEMVGAQLKLKQGLTDNTTQQSQVNAIRLLDKLIEIAKKQCDQCNNPSQQPKEQEKDQQADQQPKPENSQAQQQDGQTPARRSVDGAAGSKGASPDSASSGQKGIEWGSLPPKAREEFNQIMKEDFPETYKNLLEMYYKNLSD